MKRSDGHGWIIWTCFCLVAGLSGCGDGSESDGSPGGLELQPSEPFRIAAASHLEGALPDLITAFRVQDRRVGLTIEPTYGASGQLSRQIRQGAPFDVFLSADRGFVDDLVPYEAVDPGTIQAYAVGSLELVVPTGEDLPAITKLDDLLAPSFRRIALANPEIAPYGRAAQQVLERSGLDVRLADRLVMAPNVDQAVQYVESGNAQAGFVPKSLSGRSGLRVVAVPLDGLADPVIQTLGVASNAAHRGVALEFVEFLTGPEGQKILEAHGFGRAPAR